MLNGMVVLMKIKFFGNFLCLMDLRTKGVILLMNWIIPDENQVYKFCTDILMYALGNNSLNRFLNYFLNDLLNGLLNYMVNYFA